MGDAPQSSDSTQECLSRFRYQYFARCCFCESQDFRRRGRNGTGESFHKQVVQCQNCGLLFVNPIADSESMTSYYAGYGDKHPSTIEISTKIYKDADRLIGLTRNTRHPRFLDIGAGSGVFVKAFQERGWEAFGIELSESCVRFARERRNILTISQCPIEAADFPGEFFDIINFWHVIEHVRDPWWIIRKIGDWLKPGGILILGTPNPESPDRLFDRVLNGCYGLCGYHTF